MPPTGLSAVGGNHSVHLTWNPVPGATSYNILRSTASGAEAPLQSGITSANFVDNSTQNGTQYFYQVVTVVSGQAPSAPSAEVSATPARELCVVSGPVGVAAFDADASTGYTPVRRTLGHHSLISRPASIAVDGVHGEIALVEPGAHAVLVFDTSARGNLAPKRIFTSPTLTAPSSIAYDDTSDAWLVGGGLDYTNAYVAAFARTASGEVTPSRVLNPGFVPGGVVVDGSSLYVTAGSEVYRYARTATASDAPTGAVFNGYLKLFPGTPPPGYEAYYEPGTGATNMGPLVVVGTRLYALDLVLKKVFVWTKSKFDNAAERENTPDASLALDGTTLGASSNFQPVALTSDGTEILVGFYDFSNRPPGLRAFPLTWTAPPTIYRTATATPESSYGLYSEIGNNTDILLEWSASDPNGYDVYAVTPPSPSPAARSIALPAKEMPSAATFDGSNYRVGLVSSVAVLDHTANSWDGTSLGVSYDPVNSPPITDLAADPVGGQLWTGSLSAGVSSDVRAWPLWAPSGTTSFSRDWSQPGFYLSVDGARGDVWVSYGYEIDRYDRNGALLSYTDADQPDHNSFYADELFVRLLAAASRPIAVFARQSDGSLVQESRSLTVTGEDMLADGVAIPELGMPNGELIVVSRDNSGNSQIVGYPRDFTNGASPARVLKLPATSPLDGSTVHYTAYDIAKDADGLIYLQADDQSAEDATVLVYSRTANGTDAPLRAIRPRGVTIRSRSGMTFCN